MKSKRGDDRIDVWEHRSTKPFGVDFRADADEITLTGYASTFEPYEMYGGPERYGWIEQIDRHAFDKTLREKPDLHLLINHEGMPLARTKSGTLKLSVDNHGLKVEAKLDRSDPDVQRLEPKMRRGDMDEMSFAFRVKAQKWEAAPGFEDDEESLRTILEVNLQKGDVSVVNWGANNTTHAEIKSAADLVAALADCDPAELAEVRGDVDDDVIERAVANFEALTRKPGTQAEAASADEKDESARGMSRQEALARQGFAPKDGKTLSLAEALAYSEDK